MEVSGCSGGVKEKRAKVYEELCCTFLKKYYCGAILDILKSEEDNDNKECFSIPINYLDLFEENIFLGGGLLNFPSLVLECCDKAASSVLVEKYQELQNEGSFVKHCDIKALKSKIHIRVHSLPEAMYRQEFPGTKDIGKFICVVGTVVRTTSPRLLEYSKLYQCSKCKTSVDVVAPESRYHVFPKIVTACENLCLNSKMTPVNDESGKNSFSKFRDYQEIKIQEQVQKMDFGTMPKSLWVILEDDLVDKCNPGDDVSICGHIFLRWKPFRVGQVAESEITFKANHIQVNNDQRSSVLITEETRNFVKRFWNEHQLDPFKGRNHLISSFCPQIYGMYVVKLSMFVVLAGGVPRETSGSRVRGESHMLLVGDPGTGKSQLLKYASKLCPRSVMTTGIGTTSAGLTVSAVKDGGEWQLEAGALVLADGGVCCIDEFSCIKEHDRTSIHEAMEQQSISVAKAGIVCKLTTRCTILAATNPKGKYDPNESLPVNVALASPLLSRFDLLIVLRDAQNDAWDSFVSDFILEGKDPYSCPVDTASLNLWNLDQLQAYLILIKEFKPEMSKEANLVISEYYKFQRKSMERNAARTTVRLLESLRRLAEGHARLMFRNWVLLHDAITAISLVESSMHSSSLIEESNSLHTSFPSDAMEEYKIQAKVILGKLDLHYLWEEEKIYLDNLKSQKNQKSHRPPLSRSKTFETINLVAPSLPKPRSQVNPPVLHDKSQVNPVLFQERSQNKLNPEDNFEMDEDFDFDFESQPKPNPIGLKDYKTNSQCSPIILSQETQEEPIELAHRSQNHPIMCTQKSQNNLKVSTQKLQNNFKTSTQRHPHNLTALTQRSQHSSVTMTQRSQYDPVVVRVTQRSENNMEAEDNIKVNDELDFLEFDFDFESSPPKRNDNFTSKHTHQRIKPQNRSEDPISFNQKHISAKVKEDNRTENGKCPLTSRSGALSEEEPVRKQTKSDLDGEVDLSIYFNVQDDEDDDNWCEVQEKSHVSCTDTDNGTATGGQERIPISVSRGVETPDIFPPSSQVSQSSQVRRITATRKKLDRFRKKSDD